MNKLARSRYIIGGSFELPDLRLGEASQLVKLTFGLSGTWTASGRAALALVLQYLQVRGVERVHLPAYLCQSILFPVQKLGLKYSFYPVDSSLVAHPDPPPEAAVLLIHYFGWKNPATDRLRAEAGESFYLIEDASQALLSDLGIVQKEGQFVILSPRKFGPVPLGGWCNIPVDLDEPSVEIEALAWKSLTARMARAAYLNQSEAAIDSAIEEFYLNAFCGIERFLDSHPTYAPVPQIVSNLLAGFDWEKIKQRRRENWRALSELLPESLERVIPELPAGIVPLGYMLRLPRRNIIKQQLAECRLFCPVHWLLPSEVDSSAFPEAAQLSQTCLTLPVDQRYGLDDMERMAKTLKELL